MNQLPRRPWYYWRNLALFGLSVLLLCCLLFVLWLVRQRAFTATCSRRSAARGPEATGNYPHLTAKRIKGGLCGSGSLGFRMVNHRLEVFAQENVTQRHAEKAQRLTEVFLRVSLNPLRISVFLFCTFGKKIHRQDAKAQSFFLFFRNRLTKLRLKPTS